MVWLARYWIARGLLSAGLFVLPRGSYDLLAVMHTLGIKVTARLVENNGDNPAPELPRAHAPLE